MKLRGLITILMLLMTPIESAQSSCFTRLFQQMSFSKPYLSASERVQRFEPGQWVSVHSGTQTHQGYVVVNSGKELIIEDSAGALRSFSAKKIQNLSAALPTVESTRKAELEIYQKLYRVQKETELLKPDQIWQAVQPHLTDELKAFRKLSQSEQKTYLRKAGDSAIEQLQKNTGAGDLGFHYSLHGGSPKDYTEGGGIFISQGDVSMQYGKGDNAFKVYFFNTKNFSLFDILDAGHPQNILGGGRMGTSLVTFKANSNYIQKAMRDRGILKDNGINFDFSEAWVDSQALSKTLKKRIGIPATEFVAPATPVFNSLSKRVQAGSLSRNDETLSTIRYLEYLWNHHSIQ